MIKAVALDDQPQALERIREFCGQTSHIECLKTFTNPAEALRYINNYPVDLLFVDINMPSVSGPVFRKMIPPATMIVFATARSEYAIEAFNLNVLDYLLKPFSFERFLQSVEKAKYHYTFIHQHALQKQENISLRADYALVKVPLSKILYIEGMDDYIRIYMSDQKPVISRLTLKAVAEKLPKHEFIRVHRSYIVPLDKIKSVRNKLISIGTREIPVGNIYEEKFYGMITKE